MRLQIPSHILPPANAYWVFTWARCLSGPSRWSRKDSMLLWERVSSPWGWLCMSSPCPSLLCRQPSSEPNSQEDPRSNYMGLGLGGWLQMTWITSLDPPSLWTKTFLEPEGHCLFCSPCPRCHPILVKYCSGLMQKDQRFPILAWGHLLQVIHVLHSPKVQQCPKKSYRFRTCCAAQWVRIWVILFSPHSNLMGRCCYSHFPDV